jgi:hypothetical protein
LQKGGRQLSRLLLPYFTMNTFVCLHFLSSHLLIVQHEMHWFYVTHLQYCWIDIIRLGYGLSGRRVNTAPGLYLLFWRRD